MIGVKYRNQDEEKGRANAGVMYLRTLVSILCAMIEYRSRQSPPVYKFQLWR